MDDTSRCQEPADWAGKARPGKDADNKKNADPAKNAESAKIQWHPGFCGAFRREFRKYRDYLRFEEELPLSSGPLAADLLVIEVLQPVPMENELGKRFRKYNICEYKGPDDALTIDDYYKAVAYACLYKSAGQTVDERPAREMTVSLIRDAWPRRLFRKQEEIGFTIAEQYPGVFYLDHPGGGNGVGSAFPTQVIVTSRLSRETHSGLRILRRPADREDILRFLTETRQEAEPGDVTNWKAILKASAAANLDLYTSIEGENNMLHPALRELMKDEFEKQWSEAWSEGWNKAWNRAWNEGRNEGRNEIRSEGIFNLVSAYRDEMGLDNDAITERVAKRYHLTKEQAAQYVTAPGT